MICLVDSSAWVHSLRRSGSSKVQELIRPLITNAEAAITEWVILELMAGIRNSETAESLLRKMEPLPRLSFSPENWKPAWTLASHLRKKSVTAGAADCFLATVAIAHEVPLVHCDKNFELISRHSNLRTIDWSVFV